MEVSGQIHDPAALTTALTHGTLRLGEFVGIKTIWMIWRREKFPWLCHESNHYSSVFDFSSYIRRSYCVGTEITENLHTLKFTFVGVFFSNASFVSCSLTQPFPVAFLGAFANCEKRLLASSCLSVCPHGTTRHPQDGFSRNFVIENFSKICWEYSTFIKIG
jgi:hypothetical protein